jgi:hypothetical protein
MCLCSIHEVGAFFITMFAIRSGIQNERYDEFRMGLGFMKEMEWDERNDK